MVYSLDIIWLLIGGVGLFYYLISHCVFLFSINDCCLILSAINRIYIAFDYLYFQLYPSYFYGAYLGDIYTSVTKVSCGLNPVSTESYENVWEGLYLIVLTFVEVLGYFMNFDILKLCINLLTLTVLWSSQSSLIYLVLILRYISTSPPPSYSAGVYGLFTGV